LGRGRGRRGEFVGDERERGGREIERMSVGGKVLRRKTRECGGGALQLFHRGIGSNGLRSVHAKRRELARSESSIREI
jgi:hypothetical protein